MQRLFIANRRTYGVMLIPLALYIALSKTMFNFFLLPDAADFSRCYFYACIIEDRNGKYGIKRLKFKQ